MISIHSHNDYFHEVPLYEALQAGCIGVEADIHLDGNDLQVGHYIASGGPGHTLKNLYINPLLAILDAQNSIATYDDASVIYSAFNGATSLSPRGVYDTAPNQTLVILCDHKTISIPTFNLLFEQLEPLRSRGYLTSYDTNSNHLSLGPVTVVATGGADFSSITSLGTSSPPSSAVSNSTIRDIFFDAPLSHLLAPHNPYNFTNSYYASSWMVSAIGIAWPTGFTQSQAAEAKKHIGRARELGLLSRYWAPSSAFWPMWLRTRVWKRLVEWQVGVVNVDRLDAATEWDWDWCVVMGVALC